MGQFVKVETVADFDDAEVGKLVDFSICTMERRVRLEEGFGHRSTSCALFSFRQIGSTLGHEQHRAVLQELQDFSRATCSD